MTIEGRAVIYFFYLLNMPDEDILARLECACGEGIVNLKTVRRWTSEFCNGKTNLDNESKLVGAKKVMSWVHFTLSELSISSCCRQDKRLIGISSWISIWTV
jgi:hypothetical protein